MREQISLGNHRFDLTRFAEKFILLTLFSVVLRDCFSAPVRYYSLQLSVPMVWFLPDAMMLIAVFCSYFIQDRRRFQAFMLISAFCFTYAGLIGASLSGSTTAVASGLKMFLPLWFGLSSGFMLHAVWRRTVIVAVLFIATAGGILLNPYTEFPWDGFQFEVEGQERAASRDWQIEDGSFFSGRRFSGFSTDATLAGLCVFLSGTLLASHAGLLISSIIYAVAAYGIFVSTSRTALICLGVVITLRLGLALCQIASQQLAYIFSRVAYLAFALSPFLIYILSVLLVSDIHSNDFPLVFSSYFERASTTWIEPLQFMDRVFPAGYLLGLGFGMSAYPAQFAANPAVGGLDNFPLGIYMLLGLPGVAIFLSLVIAKRHNGCNGPGILLGAMLLYGATIQGFGSVTYCVFVGMLLTERMVADRIRSTPRACGIRDDPAPPIQPSV